jgi:hypothetical protein
MPEDGGSGSVLRSDRLRLKGCRSILHRAAQSVSAREAGCRTGRAARQQRSGWVSAALSDDEAGLLCCVPDIRHCAVGEIAADQTGQPEEARALFGEALQIV